ncbi:hypothetical protein [Haliangium ochraceum]|uniref:Uncharacterized protein n=1 Tax=Haliangium ochraceum (strain DSM 14365 / JCM 11303 / SMP-2) TaxID=502025 RepID=D0LSH3_HALO1|nr:hypothetical protein [Haliangium ochraceum]ACY15672.1 hypothetical protein Hoch_3170 [Haliangium ochraceum DSM 14365]
MRPFSPLLLLLALALGACRGEVDDELMRTQVARVERELAVLGSRVSALEAQRDPAASDSPTDSDDDADSADSADAPAEPGAAAPLTLRLAAGAAGGVWLGDLELDDAAVRERLRAHAAAHADGAAAVVLVLPPGASAERIAAAIDAVHGSGIDGLRVAREPAEAR